MEIWVYNHYNDQREIVKTKEDAAAIGRDEGNDVVLRSPFVSRKHARIFKDTGSYFIESLSLNETTVVNKNLPHRQKRKIEYGDEVRIGEFSLYMMEAKESSRRMGGARRVVAHRGFGGATGDGCCHRRPVGTVGCSPREHCGRVI